MARWRWPIKQLRKLTGTRTVARPAVPLASGEVAGSQSHLQSLLGKAVPFKPAGEGRINTAAAGPVGLAVEDCMAVPGGGVAARGWLTDPHDQIEALWLEIDGRFRPARLVQRTHRPDVIEHRGLVATFPEYRAGWCLVEACDLKDASQVVVNLHAVTRTSQGFIVLTSGMRATVGRQCSRNRLVSEFGAASLAADALAGAAAPFLAGLTAACRQSVRHQRRIEAARGEPAEMAVIVVVDDNAGMLPHLLAALEACRHARSIEVILSLRSPDAEPEVSRCVRTWRATSPFASIRTLIPGQRVTFGLAANDGIALAQSPTVAIASDEILPPNGNWVGPALERLAARPYAVLVPVIATFDHRPFNFTGAFELPWADFEHDHSNLRELAALPAVRDCLSWGCGVMVVRRDLLDSAGGLDDSLSDMDMCLLEFLSRARLRGRAELESLPGAFTHLRLPGYDTEAAADRLWSLYALAANLQRLHGEQARSAPPGSAPAAAEAAPAPS